MDKKRLTAWVEKMEKEKGSWEKMEKEIADMSKKWKVPVLRVFIYVLFNI